MPWTVSISVIGFKFRTAVTKQRENIKRLSQSLPSESVGINGSFPGSRQELPPKKERYAEFLHSQHPRSLDSLG